MSLLKTAHHLIIHKNYARLLVLIKKLAFYNSYPLWKEYYKLISNSQILKYKNSDTIFIFGSGSSINDISSEEFMYFEKHDTLSFNWFVYQECVKIKFHLVREFLVDDKDIFYLNSKLKKFQELIDRPYYKDSVFLLQNDSLASMSFELLSRFVFPKKQKLYFFKTFSRAKNSPPSNDLKKGLVHSAGTLTDTINFSYIMGYKKIVLVGVDLYDKRYFWLSKDETRDDDLKGNFNYKEQHNTSVHLCDLLKRWNEKFDNEGVQLFVYNPKSLLSDFLPVYKGK